MLSAEEICGLMPHAGEMCLIERLLEWDDENIRCLALSHLSPRNPLRSNGRLSAIHGIEYGAQAVGLHGGLLARKRGESPAAGYLVSVRGVKIHQQRLDGTDQPLSISARQLLADDHNLLYAFRLTLNDRPVTEGRVAIITHREMQL
jgi:predicted hotdog family 3-hydroxylacyl-ACP dehydratase